MDADYGSPDPTQEELQALYARVQDFVSRFRNSQSPSLHVRPMVHCKRLETHYRLELSGVNRLTINYAMACELENAFPGWELDTQPQPSASRFDYVLLIPLECATSGRVRHNAVAAPQTAPMRRPMRYAPPPPASQSSGVERALLMLMGVILLSGIVYFTLVAPVMRP